MGNCLSPWFHSFSLLDWPLLISPTHNPLLLEVSGSPARPLLCYELKLFYLNFLPVVLASLFLLVVLFLVGAKEDYETFYTPVK